MDEGKHLGSSGDLVHVYHELIPVPSWNQVTKRLWPFRGWKRDQSKATRGRTLWKKTKEDSQSASGEHEVPAGPVSQEPWTWEAQPWGPRLAQESILLGGPY